MYGLATEKSDIDLRGIYVTNSISALFGLEKDESFVLNDKDGNDISYLELRRFIYVLRKTNSQAIELFWRCYSLIENNW